MKEHCIVMEVCGTHTMAAFRTGIRALIPQHVELRSGPGCPVCVTSLDDIDWIIRIGEQPRVRIATFGDMLRVPGSRDSLEIVQARGAQLHIIYSPLDACDLAQSHPDDTIVLLGIGFETTVPAMALALQRAIERKLKNFLFFPAMKTMPVALHALLGDQELGLDGLILPGHVATVMGSDVFSFIPQQYGIPAVVAGFEAHDMLPAVNALLRMVREKTPRLLNLYPRSVTRSGNARAQTFIHNFFTPADVVWRGLGLLPQSGLTLKPEYSRFNAQVTFANLQNIPQNQTSDCLCGEIIKGKRTPPNCPLFQNACTPETPLGPCMVSSEGSCAAYYQFIPQHLVKG